MIIWKIEKNVKIFFTCWHRKMQCTMQIFFMHCSLILVKGNIKRARMSAINQGLITVRLNLQIILDAVSELFTLMANETCACRIQVLRQEDDQSIDDAEIETMMWDLGARLEIGQRLLIGTKSVSILYIGVFSEIRKKSIIEDRLKEKKDIDAIKTTSRSLGKSYNAQFIFAIPCIRDDNHGAASILCVDNWSGISSDKREVCARFGSELAWRIAVMMYKFDRLSLEYNTLAETQQNGG